MGASVDQRTVLDLGRHAASRATGHPDPLFDRQLDLGPTALEVQDVYLFEADEGLKDLAMVGNNEGAS